MQLDPRNPDLADAGGYAASEPELLRLRLIEENEMLEMVPELNPERDHPPCVRGARESLSHHPQADQHHESESVVEHFRFHEPRIVHAQKAHRHRPSPVHHKELVRLYDVLEPVEQHDRQEALQCGLVPARVETFEKARVVAYGDVLNTRGCVRHNLS